MCTTKQDLGKFEGETCVTALAYEWTMNGSGDDAWEDDGDPPVTTLHGPFTLAEIRSADTPLCAECIADVLGASRIAFWMDSQGFAYSEIDWAEATHYAIH